MAEHGDRAAAEGLEELRGLEALRGLTIGTSKHEASKGAPRASRDGLETLLTAGLRMQVDTAKPSVFPYAFCDPVGCVAQVGFAASDVDAFKKGGAAKLVLVPALAPTQQVELTVSLKGFTAGYDALTVPEAPVPPADGN